MDLSPTVIAALIGALASLLVGWLVHQRDLRKFGRERGVQSYLDVWKQLAKLKQDIDALWETADRPRLNRFIDRLEETKLRIDQNSILITKADLDKLNLALRKLGDYEHGKRRLVDYRQRTKKNEAAYDAVPERVIRENRHARDAYFEIIEQIEAAFRRHIGKGF